MLNSFDVIACDFDGVINRNYDHLGFLWHRNLERDFGLSISSMQENLFGEQWQNVLRGETAILDLLENCLRKIGHSGRAESLLDYWMARDFAIDREIIDIIGQLRQRGKRQVVATNNDPRRTERIWTHYGLRNHCDYLFSSGQMGILKPESSLFAAIEEHFGTPPDRFLLIDDTLENVQSAAARGWQTIHYGDFSKWKLGSPNQLRQAIRNWEES
jgi:HAD superfamily hydrolase (TIGR01509 family)